MMCYNQESTVARAIESVLNQQTDFSYEIIIGDDCSSDNTRKICMEYSRNNPNIFVNEEHPNYGVTKNYLYCLSRCSGEYLMGCSCDDWWHDSNKIQTQLSYMKAHSDCVVYYGGYRIFYPENGIFEKVEPTKVSHPLFESVLTRNPICALTACVRMSAMRKIEFDSFVDLGFLIEDYPKWIALSLLGDFYCSDKSFVTYSSYLGSVHHSRTYSERIKYVENCRHIRSYFVKKANREKDLEQFVNDLYFREKGDVAVQYGERKEALSSYSKIEKKNYKIYLKVLICCSSFLFKFYCSRFNRKIHFNKN